MTVFKKIIPFVLCIVLCFSSCDLARKELPEEKISKQSFFSTNENISLISDFNNVDYKVTNCQVYNDFKSAGLKDKDLNGIVYDEQLPNKFILLDITIKLKKLKTENEMSIDTLNLVYKKEYKENPSTCGYYAPSYFKHPGKQNMDFYGSYYLNENEEINCKVGYLLESKYDNISDYILSLGAGYVIDKSKNKIKNPCVDISEKVN